MSESVLRGLVTKFSPRCTINVSALLHAICILQRSRRTRHF